MSLFCHLVSFKLKFEQNVRDTILWFHIIIIININNNYHFVYTLTKDLGQEFIAQSFLLKKGKKNEIHLSFYVLASITGKRVGKLHSIHDDVII